MVCHIADDVVPVKIGAEDNQRILQPGDQIRHRLFDLLTAGNVKASALLLREALFRKTILRIDNKYNIRFLFHVAPA